MKLEKVGPAHDSACPVRPYAAAGARDAAADRPQGVEA